MIIILILEVKLIRKNYQALSDPVDCIWTQGGKD